MSKLTRRGFLTGAMATGAATMMGNWSRVLGANEDIRVAVVGIRGRGQHHIEGFRALKGVRVVALCDCDTKALEEQVKKFGEKNNEKVQAYTDVRELLESKEIDLVATATPNHWHALLSIWAVQAGKDVYVEKPVSHNVWEGRQIVKAARKHKKIVASGTQSRSSSGLQQLAQFIKSGELGKIKLVRGLCYKPRQSIGKVDADQTAPSTVNYDLWAGPAPMSPIRRKQFHYDWHWQWNWGNGDLGNQGIHQMDIGRWMAGVDKLSPRVMSLGGRFGYVDDGETPNSQIVYHDYEEVPFIFEVRGLPKKKGAEPKDMDKFKGASIGVIIECEGGYVSIPNYSGGTIFDHDGKLIKKIDGGGDHFANCIKAVQSRKHEDLNADIEVGHVSSALCHTGNISYQIGQQTDANEILEQIKGDAEAHETYSRMLEHLKLNEVDLAATKPVLGPWLKFDPKKERFKDNEQANALLTREYRKGFEVPEKI